MFCWCCAVEGAIRRKRRCVLEKKQPYSGDEWCSGAETEEEEEKASNAAHSKPSRMAILPTHKLHTEKSSACLQERRILNNVL